MNKNLATVEFVLYGIAVLILAWGVVDGAALALPLGGMVAQLPVLLMVIAAITVASVTKNALLLVRFSWSTAILALASVFMARQSGVEIGEEFVSGYAWYFAAMILASTSPRLVVLLGVWGLLVIGDCGHRIIFVLLRMKMLSLENPFGYIIADCAKSISLLGYALAAGFFTHFLWRTVVQQQAQATAASPAIASALPPSPHGATSPDTDHQQILSPEKTQSFSLEYLTNLKQTSEQGEFAGLLSSVVFFMGRNFQAYSALAFVFDPAQQTFMLSAQHSRSMSIIKNISIPLGKGVIGRIGTEKHSFMSGDITLYNQDLLYYSNNEMINSVLAVPIISEQHELLGALLLDSRDKNAFTDQHKETLKRFSFLAAALITNHRMRFYQERTARQFQVFYQASQSFTTALKIQDVFDVLMQMAGQVTYHTRMMVVAFDVEQRAGFIQSIRGFAGELQPGFRFPINTGLYSWAFQKRSIVNVPDMRQRQGQFYRFVPEELPNPSIGSLMILPVVDDQGRCFCLLSIESDRERQFSGDLEPLLSTLVGNASVAMNRALLYQKMETLATTDGLTGLPNHRHFQETLSIELERSKRYGQPVSLMLMDIDHFKSFNDTHGHTVGDLVLKEVAKAIKASIRRTDFPARYGGEEFVVIMPATDTQNALITAERVRQNIEAMLVQSMEKTLKVTVSIGYETYAGQPLTQPQLINNSDTAMYVSKESGRNRVTRWEDGMKGKGEGN